MYTLWIIIWYVIIITHTYIQIHNIYTHLFIYKHIYIYILHTWFMSFLFSIPTDLGIWPQPACSTMQNCKTDGLKEGHQENFPQLRHAPPSLPLRAVAPPSAAQGPGVCGRNVQRIRWLKTPTKSENGGTQHHLVSDRNWMLVGDLTILKHMSSSTGLEWHPIYEMENKKCSKPPTRMGNLQDPKKIHKLFTFLLSGGYRLL